MGCLKEYHIWDAIHNPLMKAFLAPPKKRETPEDALRRLMQKKSGVYEAYFSSLITGDVRITGDITPSYSTLNNEQLAAVKSRLETAGFFVKIIYLMRDPVMRNWSALRMELKQKVQSGLKIEHELLLGEFEKFYKSPQFVARTMYESTIKTIRSNFPENQIFFGFYENLFDKNNLKALSGFLDLDLVHANVETKVHASPSFELSSKEYIQCKQYYIDVYNYCFKEFPITKELWRDFSIG